MYELLKLTVVEFFTSTNAQPRCEKIPVHDRKGHLVETKYKISTEFGKSYTLNMYHTTSNCLVNGNNSNYFTQKDLPEILKIIETKVETNETTVSRINDSFKKFLQRSDSERNSDDQRTRFCEDSELKSLQSTVEKVRKI